MRTYKYLARLWLTAQSIGRASVIAALLFAAPAALHASVVRTFDDAGKLTGARGVYVGDVRYDVDFVSGSCITVFDGCDESLFAFRTGHTSGSGAIAASLALLDQVFFDPSVSDATDFPYEVAGGCYLRLCGVITPFDTYEFGGLNRVESDFAVYDPVLSYGQIGGQPLYWDTELWFPYAVWRSVPEPSTFLLLGAALVAAMTTRRERRARR